MIHLRQFVFAAPAAFALLSCGVQAADLSGRKVVSLVNNNGDRVEVADVELRPRYGGYGFEVKFRRDAFKEIYMQENNFLCLPDRRRVVCHFPYPPGDYTPDDSSGFVTESDLRELEYALLFAHKRPAPDEFDINAFNGLYYRLGVVGKHLEGVVLGVDFNRLVEADRTQKFPLQQRHFDAVEPKSERFPRLIID